MSKIPEGDCGYAWDKTWWVCVFEDNFTIFNHFRCYRSGLEVYNYFNGRGDCDSVYYDENNYPIHICINHKALSEIVEIHGLIKNTKQ